MAHSGSREEPGSRYVLSPLQHLQAGADRHRHSTARSPDRRPVWTRAGTGTKIKLFLFLLHARFTCRRYSSGWAGQVAVRGRRNREPVMGIRVLLIEDEQAIGDFVTRGLREEGFSV